MTEMKINEKKKITYRERLFYNLLVFIAMALFFIAINTFFISIWLGKIYNSKNDIEIKSASAKSINEISNYDNVTDLTGTSWEFNSSISIDSSTSFNINFISASDSFSSLSVLNVLGAIDLRYDDDIVVYSRRWIIQAYRTINITGGTDATNSTLISWLQSNATPIQTGPTQLTTPTLQSALDVQTGVVFTWSYDDSISSPYSFEVFRNGVQYGLASSPAFTTTIDGTYKVRQMSDDDSYTDSEFSNEITITGLTHFTYNLGDNVSARTRFSLSSEDITLSDFYYLYNNYSFTITFEIDNNNADTGFVFSNVSDFSTDSSVTYNNIFPNNEKLVVICSDLTGNLTCSVSSHSATKIAGKTYIYDNQLSTNNLSIGDYLIQNRPFVSNEKSFNNLYVNQYNYLVYDIVSTETEDVVYFLSNLTGQYISNSTFNYYLVTFDTLSAENSYFIQNYLSEDDIFFNYYRLANQTDFENISALNEQLVTLNENYTFLSLFGSIIDAHFETIKSLMNFNFFGVNLWSIFTLILTFALVFMLYKFLHGGSGKKE